MSRSIFVISLVALLPAAGLRAADPDQPMYWNAASSAAIDRQIAAKVDPQQHLGAARLIDSVTVIHRDGPSQAEVHTSLADFIVVRAGEGTVLVGGTLDGSRASGPGERRGGTITGGSRFALKAGDELYVPANTPHQFLVEAGKTFTATIVKITPQK